MQSCCARCGRTPAARYATAANFGDDVRRWLRREPVSARPDSAAYRARMFLRRRRVPVAAAAIGILALAGMSAFYTATPFPEKNG